MPTAIQRDQVRQLIESGAQLVEVLPAEEFEREHLPGARSIPLKTLRRDSVAQLQRDQPIIVYCADAT
jgi:rhodanese-related sulfurtransferase